MWRCHVSYVTRVSCAEFSDLCAGHGCSDIFFYRKKRPPCISFTAALKRYCPARRSRSEMRHQARARLNVDFSVDATDFFFSRTGSLYISFHFVLRILHRPRYCGVRRVSVLCLHPDRYLALVSIPSLIEVALLDRVRLAIKCVSYHTRCRKSNQPRTFPLRKAALYRLRTPTDSWTPLKGPSCRLSRGIR